MKHRISEIGVQMLEYQEQLAREHKYKPIPRTFFCDVRAEFQKTLPEWCNISGDTTPLETTDGTIIANGYNRIVIGDYGAFVEFSRIRYVVDGDIRNAQKQAKIILNKIATEKDRKFKEYQLKKLDNKGPELIELPYNLQKIIAAQDVTNFPEGRFLIRPEEQSVVNKLLNTRVAALRLQELGIHYTSSLLLTGQPGTGKTELARYIAHVADLPFVVVKFSGIISSSLGQTQANIGNMFDYAKRTPCVLCIDEIDALGTMRGKKDDVAEMSRVVISLMQELDNIKNDVIVIGTTNRPDQLDEALIRRFVQRHEVKPLNQDDVRELVRKFNDSVGYPMDDIQMDVFCSQFGIEATANTVISACTERIIEKITEEVKQEQA